MVYKFEDFKGGFVRNDNPQSLVIVIKGGIVNGKAIELPKPNYPQEAKDFCSGGKVEVAVLIYNLTGELISAKAITGDRIIERIC